MNKFFIVILSVILFYQVPITCASNFLQIKCAPQLQKSFDKIQKIPEAKALLMAIQKEGPIQIIVKNTKLSQNFGAYWEPDNRIICIALSSNRSEGAVIGSILFELHNASVNSKINQLDRLVSQGKINKANYVESMEHLEYINSLNAAKIADKGIQMGILPRDARLQTFSTFKEHFAIQKKHGHSAHFARTYDMIARN